MKKKCREIVIAVLFLCFFSFLPTYGQSVTIADVNTRTAMRSLNLAKNNLLNKQWQKAYNQAEFGLQYDETIADLWYIEATSLQALGSPIVDILKPLEKAVASETWFYWNKDAARLMLAELYCNTNRSTECIDLLDSEPKLVTLQAQYLRAKALYNTNDVLKARSIVSASANLYSSDSYFPILFFNRELMRSDFSALKPDVIKLGSMFIDRVLSSFYGDIDVLLYASQFTQCKFPDDKQSANELSVRLLKAWKAQNAENPLYSVYGLDAGVLSEQAALTYIEPWLTGEKPDSPIKFDVLDKFSKLLTDETVCNNFEQMMANFSGTVSFDENTDCISDMTVEYLKGRPKTITYDENQDGAYSWLANCDFGVPYKLTFGENNVTIIYSEWPAIISVQQDAVLYDVVPNTLFWTPIEIAKALQTTIIKRIEPVVLTEDESVVTDEPIVLDEPAVTDEPIVLDEPVITEEPILLDEPVVTDGLVVLDEPSVLDDSAVLEESELTDEPIEAPNSFYVPIFSDDESEILSQDLYNSSNKIVVPSDEKEHASIRFMLNNGVIQNATWTENSQPYAYGVFTDGILQFRNVDFNLDSFYELCEVYTYDVENVKKFKPLEIKLFGQMPAEGVAQLDGLYLSQLIIDNNLDSVPEYIEKFLPEGGRLCSWYSTDEKNWDIQYLEEANGQKVISRFRKPMTNNIVEVHYENSIPVKIIENGSEKSIIKDPDADFYWIGKYPGKNYAKKLKQEITNSTERGFYKMITTEEDLTDGTGTFRIITTCYGDFCFGEIVER